MGIFRFFFGKSKPNKHLNRRVYPRKDTRNLVAIDFPERRIFNMVNISEGGIQFSSPARPHHGQMVPCTINLAEMGTQISVLAKVVWSQAVDPHRRHHRLYRVGLSFIGISQDATQILHDFVEMPSMHAVA